MSESGDLGVASTDSAEPRERILDIAEEEFADRGLSGARVARIAERAAVNKAMLYYYYGNKSALYGAVLERMADRIGALVERSLASGEHDPAARLRAFSRGYAEIIMGRPQFIRILMRELLDGGERIEPVVVPRLQRLAERVFHAIHEGQQAGTLREDVPAHFVPLLLISPYVLYTAAGPVVRHMLGEESADLRESFTRTVERVAFEGLLRQHPCEDAP